LIDLSTMQAAPQLGGGLGGLDTLSVQLPGSTTTAGRMSAHSTEQLEDGLQSARSTVVQLCSPVSAPISSLETVRGLRLVGESPLSGLQRGLAEALANLQVLGGRASERHATEVNRSGKKLDCVFGRWRVIMSHF
jgi:hypothetical protein